MTPKRSINAAATLSADEAEAARDWLAGHGDLMVCPRCARLIRPWPLLVPDVCSMGGWLTCKRQPQNVVAKATGSQLAAMIRRRYGSLNAWRRDWLAMRREKAS
jgi:hypothetical protein